MVIFLFPKNAATANVGKFFNVQSVVYSAFPANLQQQKVKVHEVQQETNCDAMFEKSTACVAVTRFLCIQFCFLISIWTTCHGHIFNISLHNSALEMQWPMDHLETPHRNWAARHLRSRATMTRADHLVP